MIDKTETSHINSTLSKCQYPKWGKWAPDKALKAKNKKLPLWNIKTASKGSAVILYVKGFLDQSSREPATPMVLTHTSNQPITGDKFRLSFPRTKQKGYYWLNLWNFVCQGQTTRGKCKEFCIGEIEHSVKTHFLKHKWPNSTSSEVLNYIHIESPGHYIDVDEVKILDREPPWFERGVKETIYINGSQLAKIKK